MIDFLSALMKNDTTLEHYVALQFQHTFIFGSQLKQSEMRFLIIDTYHRYKKLIFHRNLMRMTPLLFVINLIDQL